jgi:hypothetical protein
MNIDYYKPEYLMVYSNIIDPLPVSGSYANLMAVVHWSDRKSTTTSANDVNCYEYEVRHVLYHSLLHYSIEAIQFEIRSHAGDLIAFDLSDNVLLNLNFNNLH